MSRTPRPLITGGLALAAAIGLTLPLAGAASAEGSLDTGSLGTGSLGTASFDLGSLLPGADATPENGVLAPAVLAITDPITNAVTVIMTNPNVDELETTCVAGVTDKAHGQNIVDRGYAGLQDNPDSDTALYGTNGTTHSLTFAPDADTEYLVFSACADNDAYDSAARKSAGPDKDAALRKAETLGEPLTVPDAGGAGGSLAGLSDLLGSL